MSINPYKKLPLPKSQNDDWVTCAKKGCDTRRINSLMLKKGSGYYCCLSHKEGKECATG